FRSPPIAPLQNKFCTPIAPLQNKFCTPIAPLQNKFFTKIKFVLHSIGKRYIYTLKRDGRYPKKGFAKIGLAKKINNDFPI
ncbi:MAG: hypothetical protein VSS75_005615, partial [Candidatus Parabeggiatoa sp.]|nr:hypothetical protein [Candidatus Parabeggiatoa sp.]